MQDVVPNQRQATVEEENRPLARRADSAQGQQRTPQKPSAVAEANQNVFKMDEQSKPKTPGFRGGAGAYNQADAWPQARPNDDIGSKIKSYIKDMSKLIDEEVKSTRADEEEDEDDDDDNMEEVPAVPETDEN
mmetsp:Transcript_1749/g.2450  ORF Transcript_1749/g.2450 Transcript_1749/m.2450 type:complete len:133 (+) Transcript_1749:1368-1766(+)